MAGSVRYKFIGECGDREVAFEPQGERLLVRLLLHGHKRERLYLSRQQAHQLAVALQAWANREQAESGFGSPGDERQQWQQWRASLRNAAQLQYQVRLRERQQQAQQEALEQQEEREQLQQWHERIHQTAQLQHAMRAGERQAGRAEFREG